MPGRRNGFRWATFLALGVALEWWALRSARPECTLSHVTRCTFRTDTAAGRVAFVSGWVALSCWWVPHILRRGGTESHPTASTLL